MAEEGESADESQKTEDPTPRKLEEARKRGQVVNSREINNWFVLFAATILVTMALPSMMGDMTDLFRNIIEQSWSVPMDLNGLGQALETIFFRVAGYVILPLILLSFAGAFSGFIQTGPLFTTDPLKPELSKISPLKGIGRLFSKRSVMELIKGVIKLILVGIAATIALKPYLDNVEHFIDPNVGQSLYELESLFLRMMIAILSILFFLAVIDYIFQRKEYMKNLRMSKHEIREEYKQTEGDPHVKGRLKQLREQKARQRMMQAVPTADVVITNPTHYAVALKYDMAAMNAPVMVAKGIDSVAQRIKEVAKENDVPIVENAPLARALHGSMEIDQVIPQEQYKAVAEVISYVFRLKGKRV